MPHRSIVHVTYTWPVSRDYPLPKAMGNTRHEQSLHLYKESEYRKSAVAWQHALLQPVCVQVARQRARLHEPSIWDPIGPQNALYAGDE